MRFREMDKILKGMDGTKSHKEAHIINTNIQRSRERSQYRNTAEKTSTLQ